MMRRWQQAPGRLRKAVLTALLGIAGAGLAGMPSAWAGPGHATEGMGMMDDASDSAEPGVRAYNRGDHATAAREFLEAAKRGNRLAQFNYAMMLFREEATDPDPGAPLRWVTRSAEQGFADAQFALAILYDSGNKVSRNLGTAMRWFKRAGDQGHVEAMVSVANNYYLGRGVPRDFSLAAAWFRRAAEGGHAPAQYILASMYEQGDGVPKSFQHAFDLYVEAARNGELGAAQKAEEMARRITQERNTL